MTLRAKNKTSQQARRAQIEAALHGTPATLTGDQWRENLGFFRKACAYCGTSSPRLAVDLVVPASLGGGATQGNCVPCCPPCKARKGGSTVTEPGFLYLFQGAETKERAEQFFALHGQPTVVARPDRATHLQQDFRALCGESGVVLVGQERAVTCPTCRALLQRGAP